MVNFQTVKFHNDDIEIIDTFVSVKKLCQNIGITGLSDQYKKIKEDESFESKSLDIEINGVIQEVVVIPASKINGWLFSINPNKVKPEVKQKLIEYKKECFNVLDAHFNKKKDTNTVSKKQADEILKASNKLFDEFEKLKQENKNLKNQLALKVQEEVNPFRGFYTPNWTFRLRENEYAYTRKDWMLLLNECERTLVYERQNRSHTRQISYKGGNLV